MDVAGLYFVPLSDGDVMVYRLSLPRQWQNKIYKIMLVSETFVTAAPKIIASVPSDIL